METLWSCNVVIVTQSVIICIAAYEKFCLVLHQPSQHLNLRLQKMYYKADCRGTLNNKNLIDMFEKPHVISNWRFMKSIFFKLINIYYNSTILNRLCKT